MGPARRDARLTRYTVRRSVTGGRTSRSVIGRKKDGSPVRPIIARLAFTAALAVSGLVPPAHAGDNTAPAFALRDLEGKTFKLSELRGKPVVLDFWATWCGPCRASMPHLSALQERYAPQGLVVLGLSLDDLPPPQVRRFADRLGVRFRLAMADEQVMDAYGPIRSIPTTFFISRKGEVVRRVVGYIDRETMEADVRELF
jgi:thiol-disulfide isomerase/thioredoxin